MEIAKRGVVGKDTRVATARPEAGTLQAAPLTGLTGTACQAGAFLTSFEITTIRGWHARFLSKMANMRCRRWSTGWYNLSWIAAPGG
jgi:hypothetical protein